MKEFFKDITSFKLKVIIIASISIPLLIILAFYFKSSSDTNYNNKLYNDAEVTCRNKQNQEDLKNQGRDMTNVDQTKNVYNDCITEMTKNRIVTTAEKKLNDYNKVLLEKESAKTPQQKKDELIKQYTKTCYEGVAKTIATFKELSKPIQVEDTGEMIPSGRPPVPPGLEKEMQNKCDKDVQEEVQKELK